MADEESEDARRQRELFEQELLNKELEIEALMELSAEHGFQPRQSIARTPPQRFSTPLAATPIIPEAVPARQTQPGKRLLNSPEEVQEALRRKVEATRARRCDIPPVSGITCAAPKPVTSITSELRSDTDHVDPITGATVTELAGLGTAATMKVMDMLRSNSARMNKADISAIGVNMERISAVITHLTVRLSEAERRAEVAIVEARLAPVQSGQQLQPTPDAPRSCISYSGALRLGKNLAPKPIPVRPGPAVAFYPTEENKEKLKTAEDTKKALRTALHPATLGVQIHSVRKVGNAGVVIQATSQKAIDLIKSSAPPNVRSAEPLERQPLIAFVGAEGDITGEVLIKNLEEQNLKETIWEGKARDHLLPLFKKGRRNNRCSFIFRCKPELRRYLVEKGRVYIGWDVVEVVDHLTVTRCHKCHQYGHPEKYCRAKAMICGACGEEGHKDQECQSADKRCATCFSMGRKGVAAQHTTGHKECPARIYAETRALNTTDYGGH